LECPRHLLRQRDNFGFSQMTVAEPHNCVYCGRDKSLTVDHISPKLVLSKPYPNNLITVPACSECNAAFQVDDEYTRLVASIDVRASNQRDVQSKLPAILRSLERPEAQAFADYIKRNLAETTILDANGKPMGHAMEVDKKRVNATGARIVRGLFFVETGRPLAPAQPIRIASNIDVRPSDPTILQFARVYQMCPDHRNRQVGSAFDYVAGVTLDELRAKVSNTADVFKSDDFPKQWKSLTNGTAKIIRRDGDRLYVETVMNDAAKTAGCFSLADLQKQGDIFTGTARDSCVCQYTKGLGVYARAYTNRYTFQYNVEITTLGPTRIEGRTMVLPKGTKLDCPKGVYEKPASEWQPFSWIPE
jgi:hypothetical protein